MVLHIIPHYVSNREQIVLIMEIRVVHPVKGKRGHPLLVVIIVVVLIVQKHKHSRTPLTNPLLHIINRVRAKLICNIYPPLDTTYVTNVNSSNFPSSLMYCQLQRLKLAIVTSRQMYEPFLILVPTVASLVLM